MKVALLLPAAGHLLLTTSLQLQKLACVQELEKTYLYVKRKLVHLTMEQRGVCLGHAHLPTTLSLALTHMGNAPRCFPRHVKGRFSHFWSTGVNPVEPLGHLESPHCTAHWDNPR